MPIDTSIITRGMGRVELEPRSNALARMLKVQGAQQDQEMNALALTEKRRGMADEDQLRDLTRQSGGDMNKLRDLTYGAGNYKQGAVLDKTLADRKTAELAQRKSEIESHLKTFEVTGQIMSGVRDQASWDAARQQTAQLLGPEVAARLPAVYDPAAVQMNMRKAMSVKDQMEQEHKALTFGETQRHNKATEGLTAQGHAVTKRGQDLKFQTDSGANAVAGQAIVGKKIQDVELKLQDDYRQESKGFSETSTAMKKVFGAIETADKNPGSALAAGTAFMKVLDPNSVVRETELGMALNASGWFDRATNIANTLKNGRVMTAEQKKNLRAAAEDLFEEAKAAQREVDVAYKKRATDYGASPDRVIVDRGQNSTRPKAAASGPVKLTAANADAEFAKLPSGAEFIAPDGSRRRKP